MAKPALSRYSRLHFDTFRNEGGIEFWETGSIPALVGERSPVVYYQFKGSDRLSNVAGKALTSDILWWAIAKVNGIQIPKEELTSGDSLRMPDATEVLRLLQKAKRKNG